MCSFREKSDAERLLKLREGAMAADNFAGPKPEKTTVQRKPLRTISLQDRTTRRVTARLIREVICIKADVFCRFRKHTPKGSTGSEGSKAKRE